VNPVVVCYEARNPRIIPDGNDLFGGQLGVPMLLAGQDR
jgi:hypothetical protein